MIPDRYWQPYFGNTASQPGVSDLGAAWAEIALAIGQPWIGCDGRDLTVRSNACRNSYCQSRTICSEGYDSPVRGRPAGMVHTSMMMSALTPRARRYSAGLH